MLKLVLEPSIKMREVIWIIIAEKDQTKKTATSKKMQKSTNHYIYIYIYVCVCVRISTTLQ